MAHEQHTYICIDLKTFYASVECVDRGLDPLTTNLVVADESRGRTTICLAITQAMKDLGIHNRCRLFEIPDGIDYITAVPRTSLMCFTGSPEAKRAAISAIGRSPLP